MANDALVKAIQAHTKIRKRRRVGNGVRPPISPEVTYRKSLDNLVRALVTATQQTLFPLLTELAPQFVADTPRQDLLQAIDTLNNQFSALDEQAARAASIMTGQVAARNKRSMQSDFNAAFGVDLPNIINDEGLSDVLSQSLDDNINLIKSIPEQFFKKLKKTVSAGVVNGQPALSIRDTVRDLFGVTDRRAKLIARDQVSKLNGDITKLRHQNLGIKQYRWQTREDDLVRATHRAHDGNVFDWDKPPADTGHPGQDINCRCVALPIIIL